jgi:choline dehydrogenase-like flavoprotein
MADQAGRIKPRAGVPLVASGLLTDAAMLLISRRTTVPSLSEGSAHLMGGYRMGSSPQDSVTDSDGRIWGIPNLGICDGSLFPTSGSVNPSLTIMANACRIGDRIAELAARGELDIAAAKLPPAQHTFHSADARSFGGGVSTAAAPIRPPH